MKQFQAALQSHLANYAKTRLGIFEEGTYQGRTYAHILPSRLKFLNFLEPVRAELQAFLVENPDITLHRYFHHLNSSQAFAFNFFYPYFAAGTTSAKVLSSLLGVEGAVKDWAFEVIPDTEEKTNVDVVWNIAGGGSVFCEVKLSESEFGKAKNDDEHEKKRVKTYLPRLEGHVSGDLLEAESFFGHYQLLRNIALMAGSERDRLVILLPRANESLSPQLKTVLAGTQPRVRNRIHVAYIEDCLSALNTSKSISPELRSYAARLWEKYVPSIAGQALT